MKEKRYEIVRSEISSLGRFSIQMDYVSEQGEIYPYSYVKCKDSVGVLAFYEGMIVLEKQYRHAFGSYELEIPGGAIELGENPEVTAARELAEETGYIATKLEKLGVYYPTPGSSDECSYLYLAKCESVRLSKKEPLEYMEIMLVTPEDFVQLIKNNVFKHSMGIVAWLKYVLMGEKNSVNENNKAEF